MEKNIDWVHDNLLSYGYTMVSTDGWMDETNAYNKDGYLDRHSLSWEHDYGWWADYLAERGMTLGVYCNPLWVPAGAAAAGIKIKGTDIPIENLIDRNEETAVITTTSGLSWTAREPKNGCADMWITLEKWE